MNNQTLVNANLSEKIIGCCFEVMNELGVGFLEKVYHSALMIILRQEGLQSESEVPIDVYFRGENVGKYFADVIVENRLLLELKCCKEIIPIHQAQLINYLKATKIKTGLVINFGNPNVEFKRAYI